MAVRRKISKPTVAPNLGLYLGMPYAMVPRRGMAGCRNVRIRQQRVIRDNLGWTSFHDLNLDDLPVVLIDRFIGRDRVTRTIFANTRDLFQFDDDTNTVAYLTPRYETGTVDVTNASDAVAGTSTVWATNAKVGDQISFGASGETDPAATWYTITAVTDDTNITIDPVYAGTTDTGLDYTIRSVFTGDMQDAFDTETFYGGTNFTEGSDGDRWYAVNGVDPVVAWDGDTDQVYRPDLGDMTTCRALRRNKNTMTYVAPVASGEDRMFSIRLSDIGQPENVVSGDAAELVVHDGADPLVSAEIIGDQMAIYGEGSITMAQYVGAPLIYVFRTVVSGFGPLGRRAISLFPDYHLFISRDAQYLFDGSRAVPVNNHVWRDILRRTNPSRYPLIQSYRYEEQGEVLWVMPLTSDADPEEGTPETAYVNHYLEDTGQGNPEAHTYRDLPATAIGPYTRENALEWDELDLTWEEVNFRWNDKFLFSQYPQTLFGDAEGNLWILDGSSLQDGESPVSYVLFPRIPLGDVARRGTLTRVYPFVEQLPASSNVVTVRIYGTETPDGVGVLQRTITFPLSSSGSEQFVSPRTSAKYADIMIGTEVGGAYWAIMGYAWQSTMGGER